MSHDDEIATHAEWSSLRRVGQATGVLPKASVPARDFAILTLRALREQVPATEVVALAAIGQMLTHLEAGPRLRYQQMLVRPEHRTHNEPGDFDVLTARCLRCLTDAGERCPMLSSITAKQCVLPDGHPMWDATRFHRFLPPARGQVSA